MWFENLESRIATRIEYLFPSNLKTKYSTIRFITEDETKQEALFPTVKIKIVGMYETGMDLDNTTVNAINVTMQIDVTSNKSKMVTKEITYAILNIMKSMRFNGTSLPIFTVEGDVHRGIIRCGRIIGNGDNL